MESNLELRGVTVPRLGLGTWEITGADCFEAVRDALALGYRHLDTAAAYGNEREVGEGLRASGVAREDVWLTTKVFRDDLRPEALRASCERSLAALGVDRVDLLLVHWPNPEIPLEDTLGEMVRLREEGLIGELGVSNFPAGLLRRALGLAPVFCDQVEYHPLLGQDELLTVCREHDVLLTAYSPFAHGAVLQEPLLEEIARAHPGADPAQVALAWLLAQSQVCAIPKAAAHDKRAANLRALELELSTEEIERIDALPKDRREIDPSFAPDWNA